MGIFSLVARFLRETYAQSICPHGVNPRAVGGAGGGFCPYGVKSGERLAGCCPGGG